MNSEERAWLAGLLEGEGYFRAQHRPKQRPALRVCVKMTDKDVVERAAALMYAPSVRKVNDPRPAHQVTFAAEVYALDAENVMRTVLPWMGKRKTNQIRNCLTVPNLSHHIAIERHRHGKLNDASVHDVHVFHRTDEQAWLAGLLEGEGCFTPHRGTRSPRLQVAIHMVDQDIMERAARLMGVPVHRRYPPSIQRRGWQPQYRAYASGLQAEDVMRTVLPWMGSRRTAKIMECLSLPNLSHYARIDRENKVKR